MRNRETGKGVVMNGRWPTNGSRTSGRTEILLKAAKGFGSRAPVKGKESLGSPKKKAKKKKKKKPGQAKTKMQGITTKKRKKRRKNTAKKKKDCGQVTATVCCRPAFLKKNQWGVKNAIPPKPSQGEGGGGVAKGAERRCTESSKPPGSTRS